jgi:hypothetical protein
MFLTEARRVLEKYAEAIVDPARSSYLIEGGLTMPERRASLVTDSNGTGFVSNVLALGCEQAPELKPLQESFQKIMKNFEELTLNFEKSPPTAKHGWEDFSLEPESKPSTDTLNETTEILKKNAPALKSLANEFMSLAAELKSYEDALNKECSELYFGLPVYLDRRMPLSRVVCD